MIPESRIRRRLPLGIIPWNPDDPELEQAIPGAIMRVPVENPDVAFTPRAPVNTDAGFIPRVAPAMPALAEPAVNLVNDPTAIVPEPTAPLAPITRPVIDAGTMPLTLPVNRGERPKRLPGLAPNDELQGEQDYSRAVDRFQPRSRGWKSRLPFIALSALQGLGQGGLGGAIGGALMGTGIAAFNPKIGDQTWKQRQIGESQDRMGSLREQNRGMLRDKLLQAQVDETTAQADERRRGKLPTARNVQTGKALLPDGRAIQMERDETGQWKPSTGPDGKPLVVAPPPKESRKIAVDVPGIGQLEVSPEAALGYYGARGKEENAASASGFSNEQIQKNIQEAASERDRIGESLKGIPATITTPGKFAGDPPTVEPNPAYTDLMHRYRALDDNIRDWRGKVKPSRGPLPRGLAPTTHAFSISAWLKANPGKSEADARAFHDSSDKYKSYDLAP